MECTDDLMSATKLIDSMPLPVLQFPVHVEVAVKPGCCQSSSALSLKVQQYLLSRAPVLEDGAFPIQKTPGPPLVKVAVSSKRPLECNKDFELSENVEWINISGLYGKRLPTWYSGFQVLSLNIRWLVFYRQADLRIHIFRLSMQPPERDFIGSGAENQPAFELWELPNSLLVNGWESIIIDPAIKQRILGYCDSSLCFAEANVDPNLISWNRISLLHGPPGKGATVLQQWFRITKV
jgi:hypothetical protein